MTTTDTDALAERIARALRQATDDGADRTEDYAAAVLPTVAEEVRKAKAEALREAAANVDVGSLADAWTRGVVTRLSVTNAVAEVLMSLRHRATEYETGDQR